MTEHVFSMDTYTPPEMARRVETAGVAKANLDAARTFALAVLAGVFIALGTNVATVAFTENGLGYGVSRLLGGFVFSLGLIPCPHRAHTRRHGERRRTRAAPHTRADAAGAGGVPGGGLGAPLRGCRRLEPVGADLSVERAPINAEDMRGSQLMPAGLAEDGGDVVPFEVLQRRSMCAGRF
jgi:Formate/nitrite transporter